MVNMITIRRTNGAERVTSPASKPLSLLTVSFLLRSLGDHVDGKYYFPRRGGRRSVDAGPMSVRASGELKITRQAQWMVTLELLETSLRLSWSPLGVQETSGASKSDAKSLSDANLSSQLAFGALKINDFQGFFNGVMNFYVFDLKIVL